jgi:hypothetical protein
MEVRTTVLLFWHIILEWKMRIYSSFGQVHVAEYLKALTSWDHGDLGVTMCHTKINALHLLYRSFVH